MIGFPSAWLVARWAEIIRWWIPQMISAPTSTVVGEQCVEAAEQ